MTDRITITRLAAATSHTINPHPVRITLPAPPIGITITQDRPETTPSPRMVRDGTDWRNDAVIKRDDVLRKAVRY